MLNIWCKGTQLEKIMFKLQNRRKKMNKPHIVNAVYSLFIIIIGIIGFFLSYFEKQTFQYTALIPAVFGMILILFTKGIMKENKITSHLAVVITLIFTIMVLVMLILNTVNGFELSLKVIIFILIFISSVITLGIYILRFVSIKRKG